MPYQEAKSQGITPIRADAYRQIRDVLGEE